MKEMFIVLYRTLFFYFFAMFMFRLMGKREVGQLGVIDLVVFILIAELVAISIENTDSSMWLTIGPISLLVFLEIILARLALKSKKIRTFLDGKVSVIVDHGKVNYKEMVKQRYTMDDLLFELRQQEIKSIEDVDYAILETNGKLSIFKKKLFDRSFPMPLIIDGEIQTSTLKSIKKSRVWLEYMLRKNNLSSSDVFYCFFKGYKLFIIKKSDIIGVI